MSDEAALPAGALPLSQRLTVKILFSFISFLLLALAAIGATLLLSWQLEGGAAAINDAGSLRMRTYQLGLQLRQVEQDPARAVQLSANLGRFEQTLQQLEQGDPARPLLVPLGLSSIAWRNTCCKSASLMPARSKGRNSTLSSWPRHIYNTPSTDRRTRLQVAQKCWEIGEITPRVKRPSVVAQ